MMLTLFPKSLRVTSIFMAMLLSSHCSGSSSQSKTDGRPSSETIAKPEPAQGSTASSGPGSTTPPTVTTSEPPPPEEDERAVPPEQVSGSFLTDLSCIVTNQGDTEATDTGVTCKLRDKRGEKFAGTLAGVAVKIVLSGSTKDVGGVVTVLDSTAADSFVAVFGGVSPQDVLGIEMTAALDGKVVSLQSALAIGGATTTISKMDLYVSAAASPENSACTKEAPCSSVRRALLFVPDIVGHEVTIHVAEGHYAESVKVSGKTIKTGGLVALTGESSNWEDTGAMVRLSGDFSKTADDPIVGVSGNTGTELRIQNIEVESCSRNGFLVYGSTATLKNTKVVQCESLPADSAIVRPGLFAGLTIDGGSNVQIKDGPFTIGDFDFPAYVPNPACLASPGAGNTSCKTLQTLGIVVIHSSTLTLVRADINFQTALNTAITISEFSRFTTRALSPVQISIKKAVRAIALYNGGSFRDADATAYPTATNRLSLTVESGDYGIWVEGSEFDTSFGDVNLMSCSKGCLYAKNSGTISIGLDALSPMPIAYTVPLKVKMSTVAATPATAEGFVGFADQGSRITFLSSIGDMTLCHTSTVAEPVFRAGFGGSVSLRLTKEVLGALTKKCVDPLLGNVAVDIGSIAISSAANAQTTCADHASFSDCVETELAD